jgi:hypothetical protein
MQTSEIASPMADRKMQSFVAGYSVAYAFITQEERTGPAIDRTGEEASAMECYGAVAMNYIFELCGSISTGEPIRSLCMRYVRLL